MQPTSHSLRAKRFLSTSRLATTIMEPPACSLTALLLSSKRHKATTQLAELADLEKGFKKMLFAGTKYTLRSPQKP